MPKRLVRNPTDMDFYRYRTHLAAGAVVDVSHLPQAKQDALAAQFEEVGEEPAAPAPEEPTAAAAVDELDGMTVVELREYAEDNDIKLPSGYTPKAELIRLIREP